jgi:hypothetical protein
LPIKRANSFCLAASAQYIKFQRSQLEVPPCSLPKGSRWSVVAFLLLGPIALNIVFVYLFMGQSSFIFVFLLSLLESLMIWTYRRYSNPTLF